VTVVRPEEVADLIRRTAELQHELRLMRRRLSETPGPLAAVAAAAAGAVERDFETAAERLREAAPVLTVVSAD
jgi:hypothetical protein